jgi:hypothetical protein
MRPNLHAQSNLPCYLGLMPSFCEARTNTAAPGFKRLLCPRTRITIGVSGAPSNTVSPFLVLEHYGPARAAADSASQNFLGNGKYTPRGRPLLESIHIWGLWRMR